MIMMKLTQMHNLERWISEYSFYLFIVYDFADFIAEEVMALTPPWACDQRIRVDFTGSGSDPREKNGSGSKILIRLLLTKTYFKVYVLSF